MPPRSTATLSPNLGLYFDRPKLALDPRMLQDGLSFRISRGKINNFNLGWTRFAPNVTLNGPVVLIDRLFLRDGTEKLIFATPKDLYEFVVGSETVLYISPRYETGTASASGTAVTGTGTLWNSGGPPANAKAGDEISFGATGRRSPSDTWFTIASVNSNTSITLTASAGTVVDGAYTIRRRFTGDVTNTWVSDTFVFAAPSGSDEWFATNGIEPVSRWDGVATQVTWLTSLGFTCEVLRVYSNMMIYANLVQGGTSKPTDLINSDIGNPADVVNGLAGQFRALDGTDPIIALHRLGENLVIYSENTVALAQFIGDPEVFVFRKATTGIGPLGPKAIAVFADYHEFIGNDSMYRFDGSTSVRVNRHVWREILRTQDPARAFRIYSHFDEEEGELIWSVPNTQDAGVGNTMTPPELAWAEHYLEDVGLQTPTPYSKRKFPFTATGYFERTTGLTWDQLTDSWQSFNFRWNDQFFQVAFPLNIGGDDLGRLFTFNDNQDADGAALPSFIKFGRRSFDGRMRGLIRRVYPFVEGFANPLDVTIHLTDHAMGPDDITAEFTFDQSLPEGGHFVSVFRRGRYYEVEFGTDGPMEPYEVSGYDVDLSRGGKR